MQKAKGSWNKHTGTNQKMWQERASLASETARQAQIIFSFFFFTLLSRVENIFPEWNQSLPGLIRWLV